jgi:hypothetical protein
MLQLLPRPLNRTCRPPTKPFKVVPQRPLGPQSTRGVSTNQGCQPEFNPMTRLELDAPPDITSIPQGVMHAYPIDRRSFPIPRGRGTGQLDWTSRDDPPVRTRA